MKVELNEKLYLEMKELVKNNYDKAELIEMYNKGLIPNEFKLVKKMEEKEFYNAVINGFYKEISNKERELFDYVENILVKDKFPRDKKEHIETKIQLKVAFEILGILGLSYYESKGEIK